MQQNHKSQNLEEKNIILEQNNLDLEKINITIIENEKKINQIKEAQQELKNKIPQDKLCQKTNKGNKFYKELKFMPYQIEDTEMFKILNKDLMDYQKYITETINKKLPLIYNFINEIKVQKIQKPLKVSIYLDEKNSISNGPLPFGIYRFLIYFNEQTTLIKNCFKVIEDDKTGVNYYYKKVLGAELDKPIFFQLAIVLGDTDANDLYDQIKKKEGLKTPDEGIQLMKTVGNINPNDVNNHMPLGLKNNQKNQRLASNNGITTTIF